MGHGFVGGRWVRCLKIIAILKLYITGSSVDDMQVRAGTEQNTGIFVQICSVGIKYVPTYSKWVST